jgi:hypothetical protein
MPVWEGQGGLAFSGGLGGLRPRPKCLSGLGFCLLWPYLILAFGRYRDFNCT